MVPNQSNQMAVNGMKNPRHFYEPVEICKRCSHGGCDVKVKECGCALHARCTPIQPNASFTHCPICGSTASRLFLLPMKFNEIDEAKAEAAAMAPSRKRGKKRKNATIARLNPTNINVDEKGDASQLRTGRWTPEETLYCDKLIETFSKGQLPLTDGIKLNDFLANMLKSKQSRLTKKMKNAKLSSKSYRRSAGFISEYAEAEEFSILEKAFYDSIQCNMERAEVRFHMQKEWRELFSACCVKVGQKLEADSWLTSVEEMDKKISQQKDAARMARRKVLMGYALTHDMANTQEGVFIEQPFASDRSSDVIPSNLSSVSLSGLADREKKRQASPEHCASSLREFSSPFVGRIVRFLEKSKFPFEHVDAWVPSFMPNTDSDKPGQQKCRLCFAGFASTKSEIPAGGNEPVPLSSQHQFDLLSFGEYSAKFSFDVGCGLPGRVYTSAVCSWEQGIENAPSHQFERCGGASQFGIKTVLGIPVNSPNVGRIVVLLYSRHDRPRDPELVQKITDSITMLKPTPKWKLVVDLGQPTSMRDDEEAEKATLIAVDPRISEVQKLMTDHYPASVSPFSIYVPGFTLLTILLGKDDKTAEETDLVSTILDSYSSYKVAGRVNQEVALMIARDCILLAQSNGMTEQLAQPSQQAIMQPINAGVQGVQHLGFQQTQNIQVVPTANQATSVTTPHEVQFHKQNLLAQQVPTLSQLQQLDFTKAGEKDLRNILEFPQNVFGTEAIQIQNTSSPAIQGISNSVMPGL